MKKAFIKKIVGAVIATAVMTTLAPLGVSAQWRQSNNNTWCYTEGSQTVKGWKQIYNTWYNFDLAGKMNSGWIKDNGRWYFADNTGAMQTGIIKINGKTYYFDKSGAMQVGVVRIENKIYIFGFNGQAMRTIPKHSKEFDSKGNIVKSNESENNQNLGGINIPTNGGNNQNSTETTIDKDNNTNKDETIIDIGNNQNSDVTTGSGNTSKVGTTVDVNGLSKLPEKYPITIQNSAENKILELMNQKRREAGLQPLTMDNTLLQVARYKSNHMIQYSYFSHTNPDGTNWTNWLKTIGYRYTTSGENIAYNTYDPVELFNQWWNSSGHRANMMNSSYNKVGIGVIQGNGKYMGTQTFSN